MEIEDIMTTFYFSEREKKVWSGNSLFWKAKAENMAENYAKLYDDIVQGYENGTGEIKKKDADNISEYRTLTKEEALHALDAAYEKAVKELETLLHQ